MCRLLENLVDSLELRRRPSHESEEQSFGISSTPQCTMNCAAIRNRPVNFFAMSPLAYYLAKVVRQGETRRWNATKNNVAERAGKKAVQQVRVCTSGKGPKVALKGERCKGLEMVQSEGPWHWKYSDSSSFPILALWGNKNWPPSMKVKKIKKKSESERCKGLQMVQFEGPGHW